MRLRLKVRKLKADVLEALLCGCVTWSPSKADYGRLRKVHHQMLLRRLDWRKRRGEDHILAYDNALLRTDSEGVETMFADFEARAGEDSLPRWVMFGEMLKGKGYSGVQEWG